MYVYVNTFIYICIYIYIHMEIPLICKVSGVDLSLARPTSDPQIP
jgi:hypothetical protein